MANLIEQTSLTREVLVGDGSNPVIAVSGISTIRETLTGNGPAVNIAADMVHAYRETLIQIAPYDIDVVTRETLVSRPGDELSSRHHVYGYREAAMMKRPPMAHPSTVKSMEYVGALRHLAMQRRVPDANHSFDLTLTLRSLTMQRRATTGPGYSFSPLRSGTFVAMVVQSRNKVYVAQSGVFLRTQRQLIVSHRVVTAPAGFRSAIRIGTQRQQVLLSRIESVVVIMTDAFAQTLVEQVVQKSTRPTPHSENHVQRLRMQVIQKHNVVPPGIDDRAATLTAHAVMKRVPTPPNSGEFVAKMWQHAVIERVPTLYRSTTRVGGTVQLLATYRLTYPPALAQGRKVFGYRQQVLMDRAATVHYSGVSVGSMRVVFTLFRNTPAPIDVINPDVGRHVANVNMLSLAHRVTISPDNLRKMARIVYNAGMQVVLGDQFPLPEMPEPDTGITAAYSVGTQVVIGDDAGEWTPVSSVQVSEVTSSTVVGDAVGWLDPRMPQSEASVSSITSSVVQMDTFPQPHLPQSDVEVSSVIEQVVVGDSTMPDPLIPASEITVDAVLAVTLLGDTDLPDPTIPLSAASVYTLASSAVIGDPDLTGKFTLSEARLFSVVEFCVQPDIDLVGFKIRTGPRPVISVSIS